MPVAIRRPPYLQVRGLTTRSVQLRGGRLSRRNIRSRVVSIILPSSKIKCNAASRKMFPYFSTVSCCNFLPDIYTANSKFRIKTRQRALGGRTQAKFGRVAMVCCARRDSFRGVNRDLRETACHLSVRAYVGGCCVRCPLIPRRRVINRPRAQVVSENKKLVLCNSATKSL